jgi:PAS domain S-box-containing protein
MFARLGKKEIIAVWTFIFLLSIGAATWGERRARMSMQEECAVQASAFAAAMDQEQLAALVGTQTRQDEPVYRAVTIRLGRLQAADPRVRWVFLLRPGGRRGQFTFLAGSTPAGPQGVFRPGDDYGDASGSLALLRAARTGLASADGPIKDPTETLFIGYAGTAGPANEIMGVEIGVYNWTSRWWGEAFPLALYTWLLLGLPFGSFLAMRDTERQRNAVRNLSEAMEQSHSAVVIVDLSTRIEYVNAGLCQQSGYARRELIGRSWRELQSAGDAPAAFAEMEATVRSGRTWQGEWTNKRKDGGLYPVRGVVTPVKRRDGSLSCFVAVFEDMTPSKKNEEALRAALERAEAGDRTKALFLATMSHEVRTPLNGIVGFTSLLLDTTLSAEQREYVQTIQMSGEALIQLTNAILDFTRIEAGTLKLETQQANPRAAVEDTLDLFGVTAANKGIELLHWVDDSVPAAVQVDDARLRQVLGNLVSNAVKFTAKGAVEVTLSAEKEGEAAAGRWKLLFSVRDSGIGIASENHGRLFKPFSQVDASITRRYTGTGLGLAISRNLVQMMGGKIQVESSLGKGSVFSFNVPVEAVSGMSRTVPEMGPLQVALCAAPGPFRDEFSRLAKRWGLPLTVADKPAGLTGEAFEIAFVELSLERARQLASERAGELPWPPEMAYAIVPMGLENDVRSALRAHFCQLINKPLHHDALTGLLTGIKPSDGQKRSIQQKFGLNVLIAEDNLVNQRLVQKLLGSLGCKTTVAGDGLVCLETLSNAKTPFDLVFMDLHMPELDGLGVISRIRRGEAGSGNAAIWITVLTADARPEQKAKVFAVGANDYLVKPVSLTELAASLRLYEENGRQRPGR